MADELREVPLFGGMAAMQLPRRMADVSNFRPVPDHQEVYNDEDHDQSFVVEIVERADVADEGASDFYWRDLCTSNEATASELNASSDATGSIASWMSGARAFVLLGMMSASKGRQGAQTANRVEIRRCIYRFPQVQSDVLITLYTPLEINELSAAAQSAGAGTKTAGATSGALFEAAISSFRIRDWGLFGHST